MLESTLGRSRYYSRAISFIVRSLPDVFKLLLILNRNSRLLLLSRGGKACLLDTRSSLDGCEGISSVLEYQLNYKVYVPQRHINRVVEVLLGIELVEYLHSCFRGGWLHWHFGFQVLDDGT